MALLSNSRLADAADSGQNERIAFVGNQSGSWQLYTINPDGSDMLQITNLAPTGFESWAPDISPDGRKIVFAYGSIDSNGNQHPDLYVINVDRSGLVPLTNDGPIAGKPMVTRRKSHRVRPYVDNEWFYSMNADGTDVTSALTRTSGTALEPSTRTVGNKS